MKKDHKKLSASAKLVQFGVVFAIFAVLFGWCYNIGVNRPPLKYAFIPKSTRDYIKHLGHTPNGQGISFDDQGPFDWDNDDDEGNQPLSGWRKEEDKNFIVYYHHDYEAKWQECAKRILFEANKNIDHLAELMGKYYYAEDMNGRKLAIYLPETQAKYESTINTLSNSKSSRNLSGTIGMTITVIGPYGCQTKGIVLSPVCFEGDPDGPNGYVKTLMHEMNHYVFFSSLDYGKEIKHYMWVSEGLAEYFCKRNMNNLIQSPDSIAYIERNCHLDDEFLNVEMQNSAYWAGESFYKYLENKYGPMGVKKFVKDSYSYSTDSVFIVEKKSSQKVHSDWVKTLKGIMHEAAVKQGMTDSVQMPPPFPPRHI